MKILVLSLLLVLTCSLFAQSQEVKVRQTFYQMIRVNAAVEYVDIQLDGDQVITSTTAGSNILIEVDVAISEGSSSMLRYFGEVGRYQLSAEIDEQTGRLRLVRAKRGDVVMVKGVPCEEFVTYRVYLPKSMSYMQEVANSMP